MQLRYQPPLKDMLDESIRRARFATEDDEASFVGACRAARETQLCRIAVAPRTQIQIIRVTTPILLAAGEEVLPTDFVGGVPVSSCLQRLLNRDAVIELTDGELEARHTPTTARYVVAPGGCVSTQRGLVEEGCAVRTEDFARGQADIDDLVVRGAVWDRRPTPKKPGNAKDDGPADA